MSMLDSRIQQARGDITRLRAKIAANSQIVATARAKAADERRKAGRASSDSSRSSYERSAASAEDKANRSEKERAKLEADLSRKEKQLFDAQSALEKERSKADAQRAAALKRDLRQQAAARSQLVPAPVLTGATSIRQPLRQAEAKDWHFFISHASPDKDAVVRPLAERLQNLGARVWFDEFELRVGDSLRQRIDEGLRRSRFGIVVLTPAYLGGRQWTENELNGLFAANKRILPVWHAVSHDQVAAYSPMLADSVALLTAVDSLDAIATKLWALVQP